MLLLDRAYQSEKIRKKRSTHWKPPGSTWQQVWDSQCHCLSCILCIQREGSEFEIRLWVRQALISTYLCICRYRKRDREIDVCSVFTVCAVGKFCLIFWVLFLGYGNSHTDFVEWQWEWNEWIIMIFFSRLLAHSETSIIDNFQDYEWLSPSLKKS